MLSIKQEKSTQKISEPCAPAPTTAKQSKQKKTTKLSKSAEYKLKYGVKKASVPLADIQKSLRVNLLEADDTENIPENPSKRQKTAQPHVNNVSVPSCDIKKSHGTDSLETDATENIAQSRQNTAQSHAHAHDFSRSNTQIDATCSNNIMYQKYFQIVVFKKGTNNMVCICKFCEPNFKHRLVWGSKKATTNFKRHLEVSSLYFVCVSCAFLVKKKIVQYRNRS